MNIVVHILLVWGTTKRETLENVLFNTIIFSNSPEMSFDFRIAAHVIDLVLVFRVIALILVRQRVVRRHVMISWSGCANKFHGFRLDIFSGHSGRGR